MKPVIVTKRDGSKQAFSLAKIIRIVHTAGLTEKQSDLLANHISSWIKSLHLKNITSLQIRDKVLEELKTMNQNAANLFCWYEQTKNPSK